MHRQLLLGRGVINRHVESGEKVRVLWGYMNRKRCEILKHGRYLFVVFLVGLDAYGLAVLQVDGEEMLVMRHESHDCTHSQAENAGYDSHDPMMIGILAVSHFLFLS